MYQTMQKQVPFAAGQKNEIGPSPFIKSERKDSSFPWTGRASSFQRHDMRPRGSRNGISESLKVGIEYLSGISMEDVKVHYNSAHPAQLQALAFTRDSEIHVAPGRERHLSHEAWHVIQQKQGRVTPSVKNLSAPVNPVVQRKYYNPSENKIKSRPDETQEIKDAKTNSGNQTAHHKVPWERIKENIENAFEINSGAGLNTFLGLEAFANKKFPVDKQNFTSNKVHRIENYYAYEKKIDSWIQSVCWSPKNIFIGPLANIRIDDPGKRTGDQKTSLDAHYTRPRSKSFRSEQLTSFANFNLSREDRRSIGHMQQNVAGYNPSEWVKYMLDGKTYYYQKNDPYFERHISAKYLFSADISKKKRSKFNKKSITEYKLHFETLYDFSIRDLTFISQDSVNYLYQNSTPNDFYGVTSYIAADRYGSNNRVYTIYFKVLGKDTALYNLKAVIINEAGRTVECLIRKR